MKFIQKRQNISKLIKNAGSIFLGPYLRRQWVLSCADHVYRPQERKFSSGLSVYDFIKRQSVIKITKSGIERLGPLVINLAKYENLQGHANSVKLELNKDKNLVKQEKIEFKKVTELLPNAIFKLS